MEEKKDNPLLDWISNTSAEEQRKIKSAAGKKSGEVRRRKASLRESMKTLLSLACQDPEAKAALLALGQDPSNYNAVALSQIRKAVEGGDTAAAVFVRDTSGEKPTESLKLSSQPVQAQDMSKLSDAEIQQMIADADS